MHTKPMKESDGTFTKPREATRSCPKCGGKVTYKVWDSSCGGYTDVKYTCQNPECKHYWWVEGPDS